MNLHACDRRELACLQKLPEKRALAGGTAAISEAQAQALGATEADFVATLSAGAYCSRRRMPIYSGYLVPPLTCHKLASHCPPAKLTKLVRHGRRASTSPQLPLGTLESSLSADMQSASVAPTLMPSSADVARFNDVFLEREEDAVIRLRSLEDDAAAAAAAVDLKDVYRWALQPALRDLTSHKGTRCAVPCRRGGARLVLPRLPHHGGRLRALDDSPPGLQKACSCTDKVRDASVWTHADRPCLACAGTSWTFTAKCCCWCTGASWRTRAW